jgi:hypothetical protein
MSTFSPLFSPKPIETLCGSLKSLRPITLELVSGSDLEPVWDYLVKQYHYLGYQKLFGHRLKYLALSGEHPVAALSWCRGYRKQTQNGYRRVTAFQGLEIPVLSF